MPRASNLRVGEDSIEGVDRPAGDAHRLQQAAPLVHRPLPRDVVQGGDQLHAVAQAADVGREARVFGNLRAAGHRAEFAELAVVADGKREVPVAGGEDAVGHDVLVLVAGAGRRLAPDQIVHGLVREPRHLRVQEREVDMLAAPGPFAARERGEDCGRRIHARHQVGGGDTHLLRPAAGQVVPLAGDAHDAAHGLRNQIVAGAARVGPRLAEAGDRTVDEARVERRKGGVVEAVLGEAAHFVVLDEDIGACGEPLDHRLPFGRGDVEGDRALPPVGRHVVGGIGGLGPARVAEEGGTPGSRVIARTRPLDLDHVGAEIGQQLARPGAREDAAEVEHFEADQRAGSGLIHG